MSIITLNNIYHNFGGQDIFRNLNFSVEKNSRIGLVGANGSGKSSLFNIITNRLNPHSGVLQKAKNLKIAYLTQEPELNEDKMFYDCILESRPDYVELSEKLRKAELALSKYDNKDNLITYTEIREKFESIDGYNLRNIIKFILTNLNFPPEVWNRKISTFSGGEKTRIQLAKFLLQPFDVMLLDEPTNHLDIKMIFWLEKYLKDLSKPYVIISHDRRFLDNTITKISELENGHITFFKTNYSNYRSEKKQRHEVQLKEFKRQQKFIAETEDFIRRNMAGQKVQQAKSRQKMLNKIDIINKPTGEKSLRLNLKSEQRSGNEVYVLEQVSFGYHNNILARDVDLRLNYKDKIALLGSNGCGKTTFIRLLNQELKPFSGVAKKGSGLKIGYYDQEHIRLDERSTPYQTVSQLALNLTRGYVLSYLARFGFRGDDVEKKISILSGGEKARLYLAKLIHEKPNFLILDEPTNHLDINMISSLEEALINYDGTVIFISHDRDFIENVASRKWYFNDHTIRETKKTLLELFSDKKKNIKIRTSHKMKTSEKKINPFILEKKLQELSDLENKMLEHKNRLHNLELRFSDQKLLKNPQKIKLLNQDIEQVKSIINKTKAKIDDCELEYFRLSESGETN